MRSTARETRSKENQLMQRYSIQRNGESRSFPDDDSFLSNAQTTGDILLLIGQPRFNLETMSTYRAVLVELGTESLAQHTGGCDELESSNVVGFARWRLGNHAPSQLIELVVERGTKASSVEVARQLFADGGFTVSACSDRVGRIVDRLMRPQFNLALRAVDDGLADPRDLEECLKLGLGYRNGLLEPLLSSGLERHFETTSALFQAYGQPQYAPTRQAIVAKARSTEKKVP